jgi:hypothetical protein
MSRTPARFNQADMARAIRAAKQTGSGAVRFLADGTILVDLQAPNLPASPQKDIDPKTEIIL